MQMFEFYFFNTYVHYSILHRKRNLVLEVQVLGASGTYFVYSEDFLRGCAWMMGRRP